MQLRGILVTGTDTGVGKTCVATLIARESIEQGLSVGTYKPVCSGVEYSDNEEPIWADVEELSQAIGNTFSHDHICPQRFHAPVAPPVAARLEGRTVDANRMIDGAYWWSDRVELLVVEGAGGLLCPLSDSTTIADLATELRLPLVIVVRLGLGSINHTLLTVEVAQNRGLSIAGMVLNEVEIPTKDADERGERDEISSRCNVPILGHIRYQQPDRLIRGATQGRINWWELAEPLADS